MSLQLTQHARPTLFLRLLKPVGKSGVTDVNSHKKETRNVTPIKLPSRRVPLAQQKIIEKMFKDGIVEPSDNPWSKY